MKEHEIHAVPFVIDAQTSLSPNEREIVSQLQQKMLEMADESPLEIEVSEPETFQTSSAISPGEIFQTVSEKFDLEAIAGRSASSGSD
jgi:hypothetical protein